MSHYHLEGLENEWKLVRETPSSQKFRVNAPDGKSFSVDIHFTPPKILTVSICFEGEESALTKVTLTPVMDDIAKIALRRSDYAVIDYTLAHSEKLFDGNYTVDKEEREIFKETL